jgi:hypothetical protein
MKICKISTHFNKGKAGRQGDQIGRIFAHWGIVYFGHFFENKIICPPLRTTFFPRKKLCIKYCPKIGWATFWETFSQTHLVTLLAGKGRRNFFTHCHPPV